MGTLPVGDQTDAVKQTNEITMIIPLLDNIADLTNKDITVDALHTQRTLAKYLVAERQAHYHFTVKGNQPTLLEDLAFHFKDRQAPDFVQHTPAKLGHGRGETRSIWTTTALNAYLDFPCVRQAFAIEREVIHKKTGKRTQEVVYGISSRPPHEADAQRLLTINRGHWCIVSFRLACVH